MKKALLLPMLLIVAITYGQKMTVLPASTDPWRYDFAPYWNNKLDIQTISRSGAGMNAMFGADAKDIDVLKDGIAFVLRNSYYKIWVPELQAMIVVKPMNRPIYLGDHLILMIQLLRDHNAQKAVARSTN